MLKIIRPEISITFTLGAEVTFKSRLANLATDILSFTS